MKFYAVINDEYICIGYASAQAEINADNYIEINSLPAPMGKKWDNGEWVEVPQPEPEPEEPTGETVTWDSMAQAISEGVNEV